MLANHTPNQGLLLEGKHHLDSKETNDPIGKWANHRDPGSSAGERERGDTRGRAARLVPGSGHSAHLKTSLTRADAPAQPGGLPASCALSTRSQQRHRGSPGGNSARRVRGCGRHRADWKPRVHARGRLKGRRSSTGDKAGAARRGGLEEGRPRGSFSGVQSRTLTEEGLCQRPHGLQFHRTPPASRERACPRAGPAPGHFLL